MTHLGSLKGTGFLRIGDEGLEPVEYRIDVYRPRHLLEGRGFIRAAPGMIWEAYQSKDALTLQLEDGETLEIVIASVRAESGQANVVTSGPIPGY